MSTVWEVRYRLLREQVEQLVDRCSADQPRGPGMREEHTVRLLMAVTGLLRDHEVNRRGQCRFCGRQLWPRRPRCTVYRALGLALEQPLDVVWWQLWASAGQDVTLEETRKWLRQRPPVTS